MAHGPWCFREVKKNAIARFELHSALRYSLTEAAARAAPRESPSGTPGAAGRGPGAVPVAGKPRWVRGEGQQTAAGTRRSHLTALGQPQRSLLGTEAKLGPRKDHDTLTRPKDRPGR